MTCEKTWQLDYPSFQFLPFELARQRIEIPHQIACGIVHDDIKMSVPILIVEPDPIDPRRATSNSPSNLLERRKVQGSIQCNR